MMTFIQEMFDRIDKEEDGEVYLREVVDYLAVLDNNIQQSLKVHSLCTFKYETLLRPGQRHADGLQNSKGQSSQPKGVLGMNIY